MHVRFTTLRGMPVTDDGMEEDIGVISGMLIHPDSAAVEGFFVHIPSLLRSRELFLATRDVLHIGNRVRVRDEDRLSPPEELVRMSARLEDGRTVLGQRIVTESGAVLGKCSDVQIDTTVFTLEWLFPRKWFRWQQPVATSSIVVVRQDAIVVRDPVLPLKVMSAEAVLQTLEPLAGATVTRAVERAITK